MDRNECGIRALHLQNPSVQSEYKKILSVRNEIDAYIKHDSVFSPYLDEICNNTVGNTMLRLLVANMKARTPTRKINLQNDSKSDGSFYRSSESLVSVNLCYYDAKGIGIPG